MAVFAPHPKPPARWLQVGAVLLLSLYLLAGSAWDRSRMLSAAQRIGPQAVAGAQALQGAIAAAAPLADPGRLQAINHFFNQRIVYAEDLDTTREVDHWDSPLELLARGAGDCEDFAIAKYFSLIAAGTPSASLRLVYVRAQRSGGSQPHMVLAWYAQPTAEPLILDSLVPEVQPASARRDLVPVFSFNAEGLWQGAGGQRAGDASARLSRWREVLAKARAEGFA
jgi:predicted transglutaminase-like cysteine proteinase